MFGPSRNRPGIVGGATTSRLQFAGVGGANVHRHRNGRHPGGSALRAREHQPWRRPDHRPVRQPDLRRPAARVLRFADECEQGQPDAGHDERDGHPARGSRAAAGRDDRRRPELHHHERCADPRLLAGEQRGDDRRRGAGLPHGRERSGLQHERHHDRRWAADGHRERRRVAGHRRPLPRRHCCRNGRRPGEHELVEPAHGRRAPAGADHLPAPSHVRRHRRYDNVRAIIIDKGTSSASIIKLNGANFTVEGWPDASGYLTLTNGTSRSRGRSP